MMAKCFIYFICNYQRAPLHFEPMHEVLNYSSVDIHFIVLLTVFEIPREFPTVQL